MLKFLFKLWGLTGLYKSRLAMGVVFGILAGVAEPLLIITAVFVFATIFPELQDSTVAEQLGKHPALQKIILHVQEVFHVQAGHASTVMIVCVVSLIPLVMLLRGVVTYLNAYLMGWVAIRTISDLRTRVFQHLLNLPLAFFSKTSTGELMSRIGDLGVLQNLIGSSLTVVVKDPITLISFIVILFASEPKLTILTMLVFPLCVVPIATGPPRSATPPPAHDLVAVRHLRGGVLRGGRLHKVRSGRPESE